MTAVAKWVPKEIRELKAYHVPPATGLIKLDAMENPYTLSADLRKKWLDRLEKVDFNRYPDPAADAVKQGIRRVFNVPLSSDMVLGNGSDELIQMVAAMVGGTDRVFLSPEPSFSMYRLISKASGTRYFEYRLKSDFSVDSTELLTLIEQHQPACIFLAYPNNPTGNSFDTAVIDQVLEAAPGLVVVDEAYFSFSGQTYLQKLPQYENLLVMRTLSKSGLAGLRLGMLMGHPDWVAELEKIRLPYNINILTQESAKFCLDHYASFEEQAKQIIESRNWLMPQLKERAIEVYPSDTNFILVRLPQAADRVFEELKENGILVKNLNGSDPALENCLRITVGTRDQCEAFLSAFDRVCDR
ncbi:MAG: histidinol-phosphate transaminase [Acidiferrobacterales bacterium]|nr:histidinol-phosphate transaminase [Acidiferrobacterales bacterium]